MEAATGERISALEGVAKEPEMIGKSAPEKGGERASRSRDQGRESGMEPLRRPRVLDRELGL